MKKLLIAFFCLFSLAALVACGGGDEQNNDPVPPVTDGEETVVPPVTDGPTQVTPVVPTYKLGMGIVVDLESETKDASLAQIDATVAAVVIDAQGKIVACRLDAVQNKITVNDLGEVTVPATFQTKMEKGDAYGMAAALGYGMDWNGDGIVKEWYDQAKAFETYVVGKTAAEVRAMATKEVPGKGYIISAEDALLSAGCTIQITDFKEAVAKACEDDQGMEFATDKAFTLGVAAKSFDDGSANATEDADGAVKVYSDFAASVVVDGKIVASLNDAIQPSFTVGFEGELDGLFKGTKRELKEGYNMSPAVDFGMDWNGDGIVKEWYLQSAEFSKYVVGKTAQEVLDMPTKEVPGKGYIISSEDALLAAGCTIQITSIKAVVAQSVTNAR